MADGAPLDSPLSNSTSNNSSDSSPAPSHQPSASPFLSLRDRIFDVFPLGLESSSSSGVGVPYCFPPHQLYYILMNYHSSNKRAEDIVVESAWYGKQPKGAKHEFIVIHVADRRIPGLRNCIALERTARNPEGTALPMIFGTDAWDAFKVSYDGDLRRLLVVCWLTPHLELEDISFRHGEPLLLIHLVALVQHISQRYPVFSVLGTNGHWFAGLVWECILQMRPAAKHQVILPGQRGKLGVVQFSPDHNQVWNTLRKVYAKDPFFNPPEEEENNSESDE